MSRSILVLFLALGLALAATPASADDTTHQHHSTLAASDGAARHDHSASRPDDHAPIGVMGEHMHPAGGFMVSYRYMFMKMDGSRDGDSRMGDGAVLRQFPVTPTEMDTQMHMFGFMWAPIDAVTLMLGVPLLQKDMDHVTRMGRSFSTSSFGVGDVKLAGLVRLFEDETHHLHLNAGVSFPSGSITERDGTPMGNVRLPYPMQLGSGTYDLLPGLTYTGQVENWSWGGQVNGIIRTGRNDEDYRKGHGYQVTGWGARPITEWVSASLRLDWREEGNYGGADPNLNPNLVYTADPDRRAFRRLDGAVGLNFIVPRGPLVGNRFAVEASFPLYQWLDGPALEQDWMVTAGWQYAF